MEKQFFISDAQEVDKEKIKEIINASFPRFLRFFALHSLTSEGHVLVGREQGSVVGFAKLTWFKVDGELFGCILWLAVHPSFRCKGFASALVRAGTEYLNGQGANAVFASVQRRNVASLATFNKIGFKRMGFHGLWRLFGWRVFEFYRDIWFVPKEIVLMYDNPKIGRKKIGRESRI